MFDTNHDEKIDWPEFEHGLRQCMQDDDSKLESFLFHFFSLNEFYFRIVFNLIAVVLMLNFKSFNM